MLTSLQPKLNWEVEALPIYSAKQTGDSFERIEIPKYRALFRNDNRNILSVCKDSYTPLKNEFFSDRVAKMTEISGFKFEGYSEFNGGRVVMANLKNDTKKFYVGPHEIKDYMVLGNSHDGTRSFFIGTTTCLLRCTNQFSKINRHQVVMHTKRIENKVDELMMFYELYFTDRDAMYERFNRWGEKVVNEEMRDKMVKFLFNLDGQEKISTYTQRKIEDLQTSMLTETKELGHNVWGLFNGATHYSTHKMKTKEESLGNIIGRKADFNKRAMQFCEKAMQG